MADHPGQACSGRYREAQRASARWTLAALLGTLLALAGFSSLAQAYSGDFAQFNNCPVHNPNTFKCVYAVSASGSLTLGKKTTPLTSASLLQGGFSEEYENANTEVGKNLYIGSPSLLVAPEHVPLLSKASYPLPGGLLGLVPPSYSPAIKQLTAYYYEHGLTAVNGAIEVAEHSSASTLSAYTPLLSELALSDANGIGFHLPVKLHLENPLLGRSCYVGSDSNPIMFNITAGSTTPPSPFAPIAGQPGFFTLLSESEIVQLQGQELVDNTWSAPGATGCGGRLAPLLDPVIDATTGLPSPAGKNVVILHATVAVSPRYSVVHHP